MKRKGKEKKEKKRFLNLAKATVFLEFTVCAGSYQTGEIKCIDLNFKNEPQSTQLGLFTYLNFPRHVLSSYVNILIIFQLVPLEQLLDLLKRRSHFSVIDMAHVFPTDFTEEMQVPLDRGAGGASGNKQSNSSVFTQK